MGISPVSVAWRKPYDDDEILDQWEAIDTALARRDRTAGDGFAILVAGKLGAGDFRESPDFSGGDEAQGG